MLENNGPFVCEDVAKNAFAELCTCLANAPILINPDFNLPFLLNFDASDKGIGALLSHLGKDQVDHFVAYFSRTLGKHKKITRFLAKNCLLLLKVSNTSDAIYTGDSLCYAPTTWQFSG